MLAASQPTVAAEPSAPPPAEMRFSKFASSRPGQRRYLDSFQANQVFAAATPTGSTNMAVAPQPPVSSAGPGKFAAFMPPLAPSAVSFANFAPPPLTDTEGDSGFSYQPPDLFAPPPPLPSETEAATSQKADSSSSVPPSADWASES